MGLLSISVYSLGSEAFQKMTEKILFGVEGVHISVDDVIIRAPTMPELVKRLASFQKLPSIQPQAKQK